MRVEQVVPAASDVELNSALAPLTSRGARSLAPFSEEAVACCESVSRAILHTPQARHDPALVALAYWMRKAEVRRLADEFAALEAPETMLVPRGLVFHVPPTNVDTMFVYSFVLSLLVGNRNVIRISPRRSAQTDLLCSILDRALADARFTAVRDTTRILSYGHEREISTVLSLAADVRMIWGGDETVGTIRSLPAKPGATDLTFADRYSLAAIEAPAYLAADDDARRALAHRLFNDAYWFDQMACSSPRLIVWTGGRDHADEASPDLWRRVQEEIEAHAYALPTGAVTAKLGFLFEAAIDRPVVRCRQYSNELSVLRLRNLDHFDRAHPGAGTFLEASLESLLELAPLVVRKDQTLCVFGQSEETIRSFLHATAGAGVDRVVPVGDALRFGRFWDGYDLLHELTRRVVTRAG